jgi:polysaccharide biosynthesis protein PslH
MKILILCNKSPYPAKEGGPIAMNMIIEGLIAAGHSVKVLAMNTNKYSVDLPSIPKEYREKTSIELVYVDLRIHLLNAFFNLFSKKSYHVERFISAEYKRKLEQILHQDQFDIIQFEMPYLSPYLPVVRQNSSAKTILRAHNIEHKIWERLAETTKNPLKKYYLKHLAKTLKHHELSVLMDFDGVAAISEVDAEFFRQAISDQRSAISDRRITTIPFGIDLSKYHDKPGNEDEVSLFSIGAMNWVPNAEGIRWFLDNVWPDVTKAYPDLKYYIAGREMPEWMTKSNYPNVIIVGEVEDARRFILVHTLMIVPLFSGSGIRIKIIEGMAAGKAILSTSIGAEGIHYTQGKNILIADTASEFLRTISAVVENHLLARKIGTDARVLVESEYNRDTIIQNLLAFYQKTGT